MDPFTMVVLIVLIVFGSKMLSRKQQFKNIPRDEELLAELDHLRERVAILEEIVTDEKFQLQRDLNRLEREG
jgi:phage shock protein C